MASPLTQPAGTAAVVRRLPEPLVAPTTAAGATFGTDFWLTYAANASMTAACSLFFRYDDFVEALGGSELLLGWIIGVGMVGSLLVRTVQGRGIDEYGARRIWLWSAALFAASCLAHLLVSTAHGPLIFVCRALLQTSMAGFYGASISYIAGRKSTTHMADMIGTLGTSGFLGILLGTFIGDLVLGDGKRYELMFVAAAAIGSLAFLFGWLATDGELRPIRKRRLPLVWIVRRYHPGAVMWMGVAAGFGLGLPTVFLRPDAEELGIEELGTFFYPYMLVALVSALGSPPTASAPRHPMDGADRHLEHGRWHVPVRRGSLGLATLSAGTIHGHSPRLHISGRGRWRQRRVSASLSRRGHDADVGHVRRGEFCRPAVVWRRLGRRFASGSAGLHGRIQRFGRNACLGSHWLCAGHARPVATSPIPHSVAGHQSRSLAGRWTISTSCHVALGLPKL